MVIPHTHTPCKPATNIWFLDSAFHDQHSLPKTGNWPQVGTLHTQIISEGLSTVRECRLQDVWCQAYVAAQAQLAEREDF